jgi:hypothetical protein
MLQPNPGSARTEPANGERVISAALCACLRQTADGWLTIHRPAPHDTDFIRATARTGRRAQPSRVIRLTPHRQLEPRQLASARSGPNPTTQSIRSCTRERPSQLPGLARRLGGSACLLERRLHHAPSLVRDTGSNVLSAEHEAHGPRALGSPSSRPATPFTRTTRIRDRGPPIPQSTVSLIQGSLPVRGTPPPPWLAAGHQPQPMCRYGAAEGLRAFHS